MMNAARTRDVLTVVDDQVGSPTSALDLAEGLLSMASEWISDPARGLGAVYNLAGSGSTSWCGFASFIMAECRTHSLPSAEVRPIATSDWPTKTARPANSVLDSSKFTRAFGIRMPDWQQSVAAVVERLAAQSVA